MTLVLASGSAARAAMLAAAGVPFRVRTCGFDEDKLKHALRGKRQPIAGQALALAEAKARAVAVTEPDATVLGADQMLETADNGWFDKPPDRTAAAVQLRALAGRPHRLHSAAVVVESGAAVWRTVETVTLHMRALSDAFVADYLAAEGDAVLRTTGVYRVEGRGAQLFERIDGSHFAVMGLPLLPLLAWLRERGMLPA